MTAAAIYERLLQAAQQQPHGDLSHVALGDEDEDDTGGLRWAPGALDGTLGHHAGAGDAAVTAGVIADLVVLAARSAAAEDLEALHDTAAAHAATVTYVDALIDTLRERQAEPRTAGEVGRWLARNGSARGAVKLGIALLGATGAQGTRDLLMLLGRHEEFTLFAAVALANSDPSPELTLWELAQHVTGWGRIHIVERLRDTRDDAIRAWLLRDGFRNTVMNEYLACIAATTGDLAGALAARPVDDALFDAAGEIIEALVAGGPAEDIDDYGDAAEAVAAYLALAEQRAVTLDHLRPVLTIAAFLADPDADWDERAGRGWTATRRQWMETAAAAIVARPSWRQLATAQLEAGDASARWTADQVLRRLGIPTFSHHLRALAQRPLLEHSWRLAAAQCPPDQVGELVSAARGLPLQQIASGPAAELGFGPEFVAHRCLEVVVQELPRLGVLPFDLLEAALLSPVLRNRHGALRTLAATPPAAWPPEARAVLERLRRDEPDDRVREDMDALLAP